MSNVERQIMAEWFPRFADIKSVEDLSKIIAYPMVIAAHLLQTGLSLSIPEANINYSVDVSAGGTMPIIYLSLLLIAKSIYVSFAALCLHGLCALINVVFKKHFPFLRFVASLLIGLAIAGVLGKDSSAIESLGIVQAWYYAILVFALYVLAWNRENYPENHDGKIA
jgi:hypothetical protein